MYYTYIGTYLVQFNTPNDVCFSLKQAAVHLLLNRFCPILRFAPEDSWSVDRSTPCVSPSTVWSSASAPTAEAWFGGLPRGLELLEGGFSEGSRSTCMCFCVSHHDVGFMVKILLHELSHSLSISFLCSFWLLCMCSFLLSIFCSFFLSVFFLLSLSLSLLNLAHSKGHKHPQAKCFCKQMSTASTEQGLV